MTEEPRRNPGHWARFRAWLSNIYVRLVTIEDTPHSIALGVSIGIFFGFTPLWSVKTLLSIGVAWLCKSNKIAAAISVQLHDLILPFMPAIYLWEYKTGYLALNGHIPARVHFHPLALRGEPIRAIPAGPVDGEPIAAKPRSRGLEPRERGVGQSDHCAVENRQP